MAKKKPPRTYAKSAEPLSDWLDDHGKTQLWLADALGISTAQASRIAKSQQMPRPASALQIQTLTKGAITIELLVKARAEKADTKESRIKRGQDLIARGEAILEAAGAK